MLKLMRVCSFWAISNLKTWAVICQKFAHLWIEDMPPTLFVQYHSVHVHRVKCRTKFRILVLPIRFKWVYLGKTDQKKSTKHISVGTTAWKYGQVQVGSHGWTLNWKFFCEKVSTCCSRRGFHGNFLHGIRGLQLQSRSHWPQWVNARCLKPKKIYLSPSLCHGTECVRVPKFKF